MEYLLEQSRELQKKLQNKFFTIREMNFRFMKNSIKTCLVFLVLSCLVICSFGQTDIKGRIKDQKQNLSFATVSLLGSDSALIITIVTDSAGEFIFPSVLSGQYLITASMIGYSKYMSQSVSVNGNNIELPDIILEKTAASLSEVRVKAAKPLYEQKIDRLIINVQSSITSAGNTVLEVLQKSPGVVVNRQNNSIAMNGKSGVRVMINGKIQQLPLDVVFQMLDGVNASNVEKIELITTPPAKYDAEGNAGIIHIVMKQNADFGTNGSFGITAGFKWAPALGGNFGITHRDKHIACFLDYSILKDHNLHEFDINRRSTGNGFIKTVNDNSRRENITTQQNFNAGIEWKLNNNTLLNAVLTGYRRNWDMNAIANDINRIAVDSTVITKLKIHESNIWQSATGSIGLQTKINAKNQIGLSLDYLYYHNNNPSFYDNTSFYQQINFHDVSKIDLRKTTPIRFLVANADYQFNYSALFTMEAGIKTVTSTLKNNVFVQQWKNNVWATDSFFTSYSNLSEQISAAYVSAKWQPACEWQIIMGMRYEYTRTSIGTPTQKNIVNRKYGYLFPTLFIKRDFSPEKDIQFSYTKRINRPTYNDIAPFVFFWGPNTFSAGNTTLLPAISNTIKAGYHAKKWIISLQLSHSKNEISFLQPEMDSTSNNLVYRSQNLKYLNTVGTTNSYSFKIVPWWVVRTNMTAQYQVTQTAHFKNNTRQRLYGLNITIINSLQLPKDFSIEISGMYQSKLLIGISEYLPVWLLNAGIQKKIGEKGTVRLAMDDILYSNYWKIRTYVPENNLDTHFTYDFHNQFVRLTYSRNFGNNKLKYVKLKSGSEEERRRINN
jgi:Outer membrane protein beta-barrel family/CarboxypepD_reg-like domain